MGFWACCYFCRYCLPPYSSILCRYIRYISFLHTDAVDPLWLCIIFLQFRDLTRAYIVRNTQRHRKLDNIREKTLCVERTILVLKKLYIRIYTFRMGCAAGSHIAGASQQNVNTARERNISITVLLWWVTNRFERGPQTHARNYDYERTGRTILAANKSSASEGLSWLVSVHNHWNIYNTILK